MKAFPSLTHVALTVRSLAVSVPWYGALFDAEPVVDEDTDGDLHHTVYLVGNDTLIGLHRHTKPAPDERFNEFRVGLDRVAFGCEDRAELVCWMHRLDDLGIEHSEIQDAHYGSDVSFGGP
jgi:catechol 2,3-dioxygenase-like lactoylglutathione lyase family enzyme